MAGPGELADQVAPERRVGDLEVGQGGVEEAEAVVVFGGDGDVASAGILGEGHPLLGIEAHGVEPLCQRRVLGAGDRLVVHYPLAAAQQRVEAEMDEHAEAALVEPAQLLRDSRSDNHLCRLQRSLSALPMELHVCGATRCPRR